MILKRLLILIAIIGSSALGSVHAGNLSKEELTVLAEIEDSLAVLADSMANAPVLDDRIDFCIRFTKNLRTALDMPNTYQYPFKKLEGKVHILYADDKRFRIINWLIKPSENVRRYYGVIQMNSEQPLYFPLKDFSDKIDDNQIPNTVLNSEQWYGCEYYRMMPQTINNQKTYLLFGFNSNGAMSNKKLIDVLWFENDVPVFGMPIFNVPDSRGRQLITEHRFVLEYKKSAQIFLNYDADKKMIVYNRISSEVGDPNRKSTFIPTGQMDGLKWENGRLNYVKEAIPILILKDGEAPVNGVMKGG